MKEAGRIFTDTVSEMQPQTKEDVVEAYKDTLSKQFNQAEIMFDLITTAKSAGMKDNDIIMALTKGGLFKKGLKRDVILNMVKTGRYIPPPPMSADVAKYGIFIEQVTGQKPPVIEVQKELEEIYRTYAGAATGER